MAHGDIKVDNYVISDEFGLKLIDFAHSAMLDSISDLRIGTPNYRAPEISNGSVYSVEKADIFSLGIVLFIMVF
jgi:serine/threonine protein kinase